MINMNKQSPVNVVGTKHVKINVQPLVSIITPVFNCIEYLEQSIQSVLNQTYNNIEHVFIDGCSTDGTLELLTEYRTKYPDKITLISEPDRGPADAWNKGWKIAKGDIFGWLGADDILELDAIQTVVEFFRGNPKAYFVFGSWNIINEKGLIIIQDFPNRPFNLKAVLNEHTYTPSPAAYYRREVVDMIGSLDTKIHTCDFDYWIRVGKVFEIKRIDKILYNFRLHEKSVSGNIEADKMYRREYFMVARRHGGHIFSQRGRAYFISLIIYNPIFPLMTKVLRFISGPTYPIFRKIGFRIIYGPPKERWT
jgi:glycosyltransferase involved in cell wall biosynthesis